MVSPRVSQMPSNSSVRSARAVTIKHVNYCSRLNGRLADEECAHSTFMGLRTCASKERMAASIYSVLNKIFDLAPPALIGLAVDTAVSPDNSMLVTFGFNTLPSQLWLIAGTPPFWFGDSSLSSSLRTKWSGVILLRPCNMSCASMFMVRSRVWMPLGLFSRDRQTHVYPQ